MQLFKILTDTHPLDIVGGEPIAPADSVMWVERYLQPGEFRLAAPLQSGLREQLPLGTLISHLDTFEVMIVEDHQIEDTTEGSPTIEITGRSLDAWLHNRAAGTRNYIADGGTGNYSPYVIPADDAPTQAKDLINGHIAASSGAYANDQVARLLAVTDDVTGLPNQEAREIKYGDLHPIVTDILSLENYGIRSVREHSFPSRFYPSAYSGNTWLYLHQGRDLTDEVAFSYEDGDLDSADYLWSSRGEKNSALVSGKWIETPVVGPYSGFNNRVLYVDGTDIDDQYNAAPTGGDKTTVESLMHERGLQALAALNGVTIARIDISKGTLYEYRNHYDIGDLVSIDGNFGATQVMRVTEYVEIEDPEGTQSYPTLSIPNT